MVEDEVKLMAYISAPLQRELHFEMRMPILRNHLLFLDIDVSSVGLVGSCSVGLSVWSAGALELCGLQYMPTRLVDT